MSLRPLDLTTALRPLLEFGEVLLFVQDSVGIYRDKYKLEGHQDGHAYLTSHRICYVDNDEPRQRSVAIYLKDIDYPEFYAGFLKSSPKITLFPRANKTRNLPIRPAVQPYATPAAASTSSSPTRSGYVSASASPAPQPRETSATWICPICSFSNPVPPNFDPATANANTPRPPCLACGIQPPLVHLTKAAIAAMSDRPASVPIGEPHAHTSDARDRTASYTECPRCTFRNHPSVLTCEICGVSLASIRKPQLSSVVSPPSRSESPAPTVYATSAPGDLEVIKLSFRSGGVQTFFERLKDALIQRKWLLQSAPPIPRPLSSAPDVLSPAPQPRKAIGIAGLERRDIELRKTNELVIGSSFSDLEALMMSAKEVIAMAERFAATSSTSSEEATNLLSDMGLTTTRDMLSSNTSGTTYITQLSRDLAELLTDDKTGVLRREGGIMTIVDLWAMFNRRRNGIELVSPRDFDAATRLWAELHLPLRRREFASGVAVVQARDRTDDKTVAAIVAWLAELRAGVGGYGAGVTALDAAAKFGWSLGVAGEELGMAEEHGAVVRDVDASGVSFWENIFMTIEA